MEILIKRNEMVYADSAWSYYTTDSASTLDISVDFDKYSENNYNMEFSFKNSSQGYYIDYEKSLLAIANINLIAKHSRYSISF